MENLPTLSEERDLSIHREPAIVLEEAKKAAKALSQVIAGKKKPVIINGEQYLEFEDWMTVARFYGITAKVISTNPISFGDVQGFEARAVALQVSTGEEISAAEAMCLNDEANWKNRPLFMLRSMAQTRACAKTLRNVLAWVVVLAGYKPTPAEEMEGINGKKPPVGMPTEKGKEGEVAQNPTIEVSIDKVTQTAGKKKDGSDYTKYTAHAGDKKFHTFSKTIAEAAKRSIEFKISANVEFKDTQYGPEIISLTLNEAPEPGADVKLRHDA